MPLLRVVGLGPGSGEYLPPANLKAMSSSGKIFLRTAQHPTVAVLQQEGLTFKALDNLYEAASSFEQVYRDISDLLLAEAGRTKKPIAYAVPGHPLIMEDSVNLLRREAAARGVALEVYPALSFLDVLLGLVEVDLSSGLALEDALNLKVGDPSRFRVIAQVYNQRVASEVKLTLMEVYPDKHQVVAVAAAGVPGRERVMPLPLYQLDRVAWLDHLTSVLVPPLPAASGPARYPLDPLVAVVERLRGDEGCPWDRQQTHESLKPYLLEETYEVLDAVDRGDMHNLAEELGDLLLQVVFHCQLAREAGYFDYNDVIEGISRKLQTRHPHVFGTARWRTAAEVKTNWERLKSREKGGVALLLDSVPRSLPALLRASRIQEKAGKIGFDWQDASGPWEKIAEEINELRLVLTRDEGRQRRGEELGDLLFSVTNLARFLEVDPEGALQVATNKFIHRLRRMEVLARAGGKELEGMALEELEGLWGQVKEE